MDTQDATTTQRSIQELIREEARLQSILTGMLDPVVTMTARGIILSANASCTVVFGYEPDEMLGKNVRMLMPEPHHSAHDSYLANYRRTGKTNILGETRQLPARRKDGETIEIELSVSRIDVPGQTEPIFCGSFRDVTSRVAAERALAENERLFRAIFEQEYQYVGFLDPEGRVLAANATALAAAGVEREDVLGRPFWETPWWSHSTEEQDRLREAIQSAAKGQFERFETTHVRKDGRLINIDFSLKPIRDDEGKVVRLLPEGRDITDIKLAQQRETSMMRAFAEIGESASLLAHEIKNPITAVNTALRAVAKQLGEDEKQILEDLVERMQKLEKLMRRTLSLARPLELRPSECETRVVLDEAIEVMRPHLEAIGAEVTIEVHGDCRQLQVDAQLLEEVLTNLLRNAIDALATTESGGSIRIAAEPDERGIVLVIEDDGPGIPEAVLATLFKPFVSTKTNGTGLGLALARKVVEAHGGTIEAHNSKLGGARFEIRLPRRPPA